MHAQTWDPAVLVHTAFTSQLSVLVVHSLGNRLVVSLLSLCDALSRYIPYLFLSYFHFMGKAWPIKLTFYNVNNFIAYVAGVQRGRGQGGREKGGGMGAG